MKTEAELSFNRQLDLWDLWDLRLCSSTYGSESVKLDVEDCTLIPARSLSITFRLFGNFFSGIKRLIYWTLSVNTQSVVTSKERKWCI